MNKLFESIKNLPNGKKRQALINQLIEKVRKDSPWVWGFNPISFTLTHQWNRPVKPNAMANNTLKYEKVNTVKRAKLRKKWNQSIAWPMWVLLGLIGLIAVPLVVSYWRRERQPTVKRYK